MPSLSQFKPSYAQAVLMVILGGACLSLLGIADRSMDGTTGPQIVFYRAVSQTIFFGLIFVLTTKTKAVAVFKAIGWRGWITALFMALAGFFMVMSLQYTEVANAIFIVSLTPLIAALLAWIFIKEVINRRTVIAMAIALFGVAVIFGSNLNPQGIFGMGLALCMATFYASSIVMMRTIPGANVLLLSALCGLLTLLIMLPIVENFTLTPKDLTLCLGLGVVQVGLGTLLVMTGAKYVPAAQVSILALLEVVLSPLWVWIFVNEVPAITTLIGGGIVLVGVVYQATGAKNTSEIA